MSERSISMPVGVVVRRSAGVTKWASWAWSVVGVFPGASPLEEWRVLRRDRGLTDFHAATVPLELHRSETEAYKFALSARTPCVYVVLRSAVAEFELEVLLATASPYEAQDYLDSGEEIVEAVPMSRGLIAWIRDFVDRHHVDREFIKRKRDRVEIGRKEDGRGDSRIFQTTDVYRAPRRIRPGHGAGETVH